MFEREEEDAAQTHLLAAQTRRSTNWLLSARVLTWVFGQPVELLAILFDGQLDISFLEFSYHVDMFHTLYLQLMFFLRLKGREYDVALGVAQR
jgi:hypothetical protein